jgi:hypothetical protein
VHGECVYGDHVEVGLMRSWFKLIRRCVHGVDLGLGRMGAVAGMKPLLHVVNVVRPEGVVLMVSWSWRQRAH